MRFESIELTRFGLHQLRDHFDAASVEWELDRSYGPPPGLDG